MSLARKIFSLVISLAVVGGSGCGGGGGRLEFEDQTVRIDRLAWRDVAVWVTDTTATVRWQTRDPKTSQVFYGTTTRLDQKTPEDPTLTTAHEVTLEGLQPNTLYYFLAVGRNETGDGEVKTDLRQLTTHNGALSRIAFVSDRALPGECTAGSVCWGDQRLWIMNADGTNPRPLTVGSGAQPCWSPDGTWLVFQTQRDGNGELYAINADGTNLRNLTHTPNLAEWDPALSPDGTRLAFARAPLQRGAGGSAAELYVLDLVHGGEPVQITSNQVLDEAPTWSPDGAQLAFVSTERTALVALNHPNVRADSVVVTDLSGVRLSEDQFVVHAEEGVLDFTAASNVFGQRVRIQFRWAVEGGEESGTMEPRVPFPNREIFVMNADGSGRHNLTNHESSDTQPDWSPTGRLAFVSDREGNQEIYTMDSNGGNVVNVTRHLDSDAQPSWSPDGNSIAFVSNRTGLIEIFTLPAGGGEAVNVTNFTSGDIQPAWGPAGSS